MVDPDIIYNQITGGRDFYEEGGHPSITDEIVATFMALGLVGAAVPIGLALKAYLETHGTHLAAGAIVAVAKAVYEKKDPIQAALEAGIEEEARHHLTEWVKGLGARG